MSLWEQFPPLAADLKGVSSLIAQTAQQSPVPIRKELSRLLLTPGKMLRPALVILSAAWGEGRREGVLRGAAAVELLHMASLVHDDVLDDAPVRRGVETLHRTMGVKKAVLAGDYLLAQALRLAADFSEPSLVKTLAEGVERMCRGEMDQDFRQGTLRISREEYLARIRGKTAELFGLACLAGGTLGGCASPRGEELFRLGLLYGTAFQIEDDVSDYRGGAPGKPGGRDLRAGIPTLPLIEALEAGDPAARAYADHRALRLFPGLLRRRILRLGYAARAEESAREYRSRAAALLATLPETSSTPVFRRLLEL